MGLDGLTHWEAVGVTAVLILVSTLINVISVRWGARFINAGVFATIVACVLDSVILAAALIFGHSPVHGVGYLFTTQGRVGGSIALPLLFAALLSCIVLNGFDVSGNASEETKRASRSVPGAW